MSIPDNPGPDDDLFKQLQDIAPPDDQVNVRLLSDFQLADVLGDVRQELIDMGEMLEPKTERGRDRHSLRAALLIEQRRRWRKDK